MGRETDRVIGILNKAGEIVVGQIIIRGHQTLASATPVDTGFARSGWTPSTGTPVLSQDNPPPQKEVARSVAGSRLQDGQQAAARIAATYKLRAGQAFLTNRVPYIEKLNNGSSAQAPARFIERALLAAVKSVDSSLIRKLNR